MTKKMFLLCCAVLLIFASIAGCAAPQADVDTPKNAVFTDDYFHGATSMQVTPIPSGQNSEDMEKVIRVLQGLELEPTEDTVLPNTGTSLGVDQPITGVPNAITFTFPHGHTARFLFNDSTISFSADENYHVVSEDLKSQIFEAVGYTPNNPSA